MKRTILGVSLGSRTTGIAIVKDGELLAAHSLTLRNKATKVHIETLDRYIRQYRIELVVVKMPPDTHISKRLSSLLQECARLFRHHGCTVERKSTMHLKERLPKLTNKAEAIRFATSTYPYLTPFYERELTNKQKYHIKMFEAVLIAHLKRIENEMP